MRVAFNDRPTDGPGLVAGGAALAINPPDGTFLYGYPHVPRLSTGVHDDLLCSALYLRAAEQGALILANDLIFVGRELVEKVRAEIGRRTGLPPEAIAVAATHTHSGPVTVSYLSNRADPVVPPPDPAYLEWLAERMVAAACAAVARAAPAEIGLATTRTEGVGTNRHDPHGPADPEAAVLMVRDRSTRTVLGCAVNYAMHPTVLHADSTQVSSDFLHFLREHLRVAGLVPAGAPILFLNGASGDQSPRHVVRAHSFAEARRLGELLGRFVAAAAQKVDYLRETRIACGRAFLPLEPRALPALAAAEIAAEAARSELRRRQASAVPAAEVRTAECDVFGAEETVELARAAADGSLARMIARCSPAEIQLLRIGPWRLVFWPGEFFAAFGLELKARSPQTFLVTLANGELQGYIVTAEAAAARVYESGNAVFAPANGPRFVAATLELIESVQ